MASPLVLLAFFCYFLVSARCDNHNASMAQRILVGGYSRSIVLACVSHDNARLYELRSFHSGPNASFLAHLPTRARLYAVNEVAEGAVETFRLSGAGNIRSNPKRHPAATHGASPIAISIDPSGEWLLFADYYGGSFGSIAIDDHTGALRQEPTALVVVDHGMASGAVQGRQDSPHPHQMITDPSGKYAFVPDLGADVIHQYVLNRVTGELLPNPASAALRLHPGTGPRHLIFSLTHPGRAYSVNELANTVHLYAYDDARGTLRLVKAWSTLDDTVANKSACAAAELVLSPDGKFLYASNRHDTASRGDTIAVFSVEAGNGELHLLGLDAVGGSVPRHFAIDPSGSVVVVGLQGSNAVSLLRRDGGSGRLSLVDTLGGIEAPAFILFL